MPIALKQVSDEEFAEVFYRVYGCMQRYGKKKNFAQYVDYEVYESSWGLSQVLLRIMNLHVLNARIVAKLRRILKNKPGWEIMVRIEDDDDVTDCLAKGIRIRTHEIVDALQRDCLPPEFRSLTFIDVRPAIGSELT